MSETVVTGLGVVAPSGLDAERHWRSTLRGELKVGTIDTFDATRYGVTLAGQVRGFDVTNHVDGQLAVQTDRWTWFSLAAAQEALDDAKYDPQTGDPYDTSLVLAAGSGGNEFGQREIQALWSRGRRAVSVYQSIAWFYAASAGQLAIKHGSKGPASVIVSGGAGGLDSLAVARRLIRRGSATALAGGTEAGIAPYALTCQAASGQLSASADPRDGYKPFDASANGYVPGEGGAVLVLESAEAARRRSAPHIYGEIAGYAATHDGRGDSGGSYLAAAMRGALSDAGVLSGEVDLVIADGAGIPELDAAETDAIAGVFGDRGVPVTAPQGLIGRLCAGGSALNAVNALLAIRDGIAPAVGNLSAPASGRLDLVTEPRKLPIRTVLVNARGYGGFNSSVVIRACTD